MKHLGLTFVAVVAASFPGESGWAAEEVKDCDRYVDGCVRTLGRFEDTLGYYVREYDLMNEK